MSAVERLAILITADGQGAVREFSKVGQAAERDLGKAESTADRLGARMTSAGALMMGASAVMAAGMWNAGRSAAALEQSVGGAEAVFKDSAGVLRSWAEGAAESAGLSEEAALRLTTRLGGALKGLGFDQAEAADQSIKLTQIAADLAATYGGTTADAVQALGSAFRGEFDPAEQFNLFLKQSTVDAKAVEMGLAQSTSQVDAHARAQATLALIMEQSTDAQGQFARETDSTSGRLQIAQAEFENLKAQIGAGFTPVMTAAGSVLGVVTNGLRSADDATGGLASQMVGFGTVTLGTAGAISFAAGQVIRMRDHVQSLTTWLKESEAASRVMSTVGAGSMTGPLLAAAGAVTVLAIAWQNHAAEQARNRQLESSLTEELKKQTAAVDETTDAWIRKQFVESSGRENIGKTLAGTSAQLDVLTRGIREQGTELDYWRERIANYGDGWDELRPKIEAASDAGDEFASEMLRLVESGEVSGSQMVQLIRDFDFLNDRTDAATAEYDVYRAVLGDTTGAQQDQTAATQGQTAATQANTEAVRAQQDAYLQLAGGHLGLQSAQLASKEALDEYNSKMADSTLTATQREQAGVDLLQTYQREAEAAVRLADDQAKASGATLDGATKANIQSETLTRLAETLAPDSPLRAQLAGYIWVLGQVPRDVPTTVRVWGAEDAVAKLNRVREAALGARAEAMGFGVFSGYGAESFFTDPAHRAGGGPVAPWSAYVVHDTSAPELLSLNDGTSMLLTGASGGQVTNLADAARPLSAAGSASGSSTGTVVNFNVSVNGGGIDGGGGAFLRWLRQNQGEVQRAIGLN